MAHGDDDVIHPAIRLSESTFPTVFSITVGPNDGARTEAVHEPPARVRHWDESDISDADAADDFF